MEEQITITKREYLNLLKRDAKLGFLEAGGVDNWEWYGESLNPDGGESYSDVRDFLDKQINNIKGE